MGDHHINEALFFPVDKLPCRFYAEHGKCKNGDGCRFSHRPTSLTRLLEYLNGAKVSMDVCVFTISLDDIADAIIRAHQRGVKVRLIFDDEKAGDKGNDMKRMIEAGIAGTDDKSEFHMHHKFAVIDHKILLNGSLNWTTQGVLHNRENVVISNDAKLVKQFEDEFQLMWNLFRK